jgi:methionyl-tRNA formyltransferase
MKQSSTLLFFGNERLSSGFSPNGAPILEALIAAGYTIAAVVSHYEMGRSRNSRPLEVETVAKRHNIPVLLPERPKDIIEQLKSFNAIGAVLVAYGKIIPQSVIDIFPAGIINIHPSLLPKYRGSTPIEQAILDGTHETGISVMQLTKGMDAGPIFAQEHVLLHGTETKHDLTEQLLKLGGKLLIQYLPSILAGDATLSSQDESKATYTQLLSKASGSLDWQKPAATVEREVRAYFGWPKSYTTLFGHHIIITKARIARAKEDGSFVVACNPGWLEILELTAPSGRTMSGADFLRGYSPVSS